MREDERGERVRDWGRVWNEKRAARARGIGGREGEIIARNSSPGRCGVEGIIQTLLSLSPLLHLSKRVCESWQSVCVWGGGGHVGPLRGQGKKLWLYSSSLCAGPTAAHRHLASHWSLISTDREEEKSAALRSLSHRKIIDHLLSILSALLFFFFYVLFPLFLLLFFIFTPLSSCLAFLSILWLFSYPWHCTIF